MDRILNQEELENDIKAFSEKHNCTLRLPGMRYYLFPKDGEYGWPEQFPFCGESGVYAFLDNNNNVIYIGHTYEFGQRLSQYFKYDENRKCKVANDYYADAKSILAYKVEKSEKYMCLALEEYLISKFNPRLNIRSRSN